MRKFCYYRKCSNSCRGLKPGALKLINTWWNPRFPEPGTGASTLLIQTCTAFTGETVVDCIPKAPRLILTLPQRAKISERNSRQAAQSHQAGNESLLTNHCYF